MKKIFILMIILLILGACALNDSDSSDEDVLELDIPTGFHFRTEKEVALQVDLRSTEGTPVPGVVYHVYYTDSRGMLQRTCNLATDGSGMISSEICVPNYVQSLYLSGFMNNQEIPVTNGIVYYSFGGGSRTGTDTDFRLPSPSRDFSTLPGIYYNSQGVPYPVLSHTITSELLTRIDTSLPEQISLDNSHPQYLADNITTNLVIEDSSDVWLTFVTEGAGHRNALGFYTYDINEGPPEDPSELEHTLVFPNCSLSDSGGGMEPGMKLHLGQFGAGTVMGWFLVANGWQGGDQVSGTRQRYYSDRRYNPEEEEYNQHSVLLYDSDSELFLMAFEDLERPWGDNDFNDAVFFATANPIENINTDNVPPIDIPVDSDEDGVNDPFDEFPDDPDRAFKVYYPSESEHATLVFEDKWPEYGDYDMNDMVIDYQYILVTSAQNEVWDIEAEFTMKAAGAGYNNGFSVQLPFEYANTQIDSSSANIFPALINDGNYTILDLFQNASSITGLSSGTFFNTEQEETYYNPVDFFCKLTLDEAVLITELDFSFPFNPFLIRNGVNSHEIHLMNYPSTNRMNESLFMTSDDNSDPAEGDYYVSPLNLPWGLNLPESWLYPAEKNSIVETYNYFADWAESGGTQHSDWFSSSESNYDPEKIYNIP